MQPRITPRPATRMPDRLHFALIRASGCNPNAPGAAQLIAQWPTAAQLRGNPAAKRALWPQLRALRKQSLP
jgi:DNA polymerase III psi subunit